MDVGRNRVAAAVIRDSGFDQWRDLSERMGALRLRVLLRTVIRVLHLHLRNTLNSTMVADPVADKSGFLCTYMSTHPDTLVAYVKYFGNVDGNVSSAKMLSIDSKVRLPPAHTYGKKVVEGKYIIV